MNRTNEKRDLFLDMQAHPEKYTDEQIEAMMSEVDATPDVEAQWQRFEEKVPQRTRFVRMPWMRHAAVIAVGILLSGVVYAITVATGLLPNVFAREENTEKQETVATAGNAAPQKRQGQETGVVTYDDVPFADILQDMAEYYGMSVVYRNTQAKTMRLHFQWNRSASLADNIAALNAFRQIQISIHAQQLTVE